MRLLWKWSVMRKFGHTLKYCTFFCLQCEIFSGRRILQESGNLSAFFVYSRLELQTHIFCLYFKARKPSLCDGRHICIRNNKKNHLQPHQNGTFLLHIHYFGELFAFNNLQPRGKTKELFSTCENLITTQSVIFHGPAKWQL